MRVAHVITRLVVGGAQENTIASVLGLNEKPGVEASLISGFEIGAEGSLAGSIPAKPGLLVRIPELVRPVHPLQDWLAYRHLARHFQSTKPHVVHTHSGKAGILGRLAARKTGVPLVFHTIHGPSFGPFQGAFPNWLFKTAERRAALVTDHFVAVADAMIEQYLKAEIGSPGDYTKILSGFDTGPFARATPKPELRKKLGISEGDFVVGKIARLFKLKGHGHLFAVARELVQKCPGIKFLLVGDGPWRDKFEVEASRLGLRERFVFTGLVSPAEVPDYLALMHVLVHLSSREGLARALPQAMAAGKPVVAMDCDGAREACLDGETGFLIPCADEKALIARIVELHQNPGLRERMGARGREFATSRFSAQKMVDDLHGLYVRLWEAKFPGDATAGNQ